MLAVLRLCNDTFLTENVFPLLEAAAAPDSTDRLPQALFGLASKVDDVRALELAMQPGVSVGDSGLWKELVHRLLFALWEKAPSGKWRCVGEKIVYAGALEEAFEASLMMELPRFNYWEPEKVQAEREDWQAFPRADVGLASLLRGAWETAPGFPPDAVTGSGAPTSGVASESDCLTARWTYRDARTVRAWSTQLAAKLNRLMWREAERLKPVEIPEAAEILDVWLGKKDKLPPFTVAFSALGPSAGGWMGQIAQLSKAVRDAAALGSGLLLQLAEAPLGAREL